MACCRFRGDEEACPAKEGEKGRVLYPSSCCGLVDFERRGEGRSKGRATTGREGGVGGRIEARGERCLPTPLTFPIDRPSLTPFPFIATQRAHSQLSETASNIIIAR